MVSAPGIPSVILTVVKFMVREAPGGRLASPLIDLKSHLLHHLHLHHHRRLSSVSGFQSPLTNRNIDSSFHDISWLHWIKNSNFVWEPSKFCNLKLLGHPSWQQLVNYGEIENILHSSPVWPRLVWLIIDDIFLRRCQSLYHCVTGLYQRRFTF